MRRARTIHSDSAAGLAQEANPASGAQSAAGPAGLWPVDRLMLGYLLAISLLVAVLHQRIADAGGIILLHAAGALPIVAFVIYPRLPGARIFRHWYPLPYTYVCYGVTSLIIPALWPSIRNLSVDARLAAWDYAIWGANPTVWLERIQTPLVTELIQITYSLFVPMFLAVAVIFWIRNRRDEFRSYAFVLALGFLVSYVGYVCVPARGPRFYLDGLQTQPLAGLWLYGWLRGGLDQLESAHYDCFPSGHMEMTILAWWWSRRISTPLAVIYGLYSVCMLLATTYLRYHYTVDLVAGVVAAVAVLTVAPRLMRWWQ